MQGLRQGAAALAREAGEEGDNLVAAGDYVERGRAQSAAVGMEFDNVGEQRFERFGIPLARSHQAGGGYTLGLPPLRPEPRPRGPTVLSFAGGALQTRPLLLLPRTIPLTLSQLHNHEDTQT